jgi:hypothetical protein
MSNVGFPTISKGTFGVDAMISAFGAQFSSTFFAARGGVSRPLDKPRHDLIHNVDR